MGSDSYGLQFRLGVSSAPKALIKKLQVGVQTLSFVFWQGLSFFSAVSQQEDSSDQKTLPYTEESSGRTEESSVRNTLPYGRLFRT